MIARWLFVSPSGILNQEVFTVDEMDGENREMLKIGTAYILNRPHLKKWKSEYRNPRKTCFFKTKAVAPEDSKSLIFSSSR